MTDIRRVGILGTGSYVPERVLSNADLERMVDTSDEWIFTRTGMRERRIAAPDEATSDLCVAAAGRAIADSGIDPLDVDLIIIATVTPDQTVADAARMMRDEDVGSLPVVEEGRLVGIVTDRDIVLRVVADGRDPSSTPVREACSRETVTIEPEQELEEALRLMARHQVRRLPVVDDGDRLVGMVAQADVAGAGGSQQVADTLEEISKPASQ